MAGLGTAWRRGDGSCGGGGGSCGGGDGSCGGARHGVAWRCESRTFYRELATTK